MEIPQEIDVGKSTDEDVDEMILETDVGGDVKPRSESTSSHVNTMMIETVFSQIFLLISSVSTEQSQFCVKNTNPSKQER